MVLDVEIELVEKGSRGIAVLKLFGPNKKKENVVMVMKSKGSESKYVTMLDEQIIQLLVKEYLSGDDNEISDIKKSVSVRGKYIKLIKCPYCDENLLFWPGIERSYYQNAQCIG